MIIKTDTRQERELNIFDRALITASYFGFRPVQAPKITKEDLELTRSCGEHPHYDAAEKLAMIRMYVEKNLASLPPPIALVYKKPASRKRFGDYGLHFIGATSGIAEAALIRTSLSILSEEGYKNLSVDINCLGDRESINIYERGLINHVRKFGSNLPEDTKRSIKEDIFNLFKLDLPETKGLRDTAPSAITYLSTQSRQYFKEVLEYIEALGIEFRLAPELVGEKNHVSHTIFAIKDNEERKDTLAIGYRYSRLGRLIGIRKEIPMAAASIFSYSKKETKERMYKELPKPKFFLVQLGREAKIKTLSLIELLRTHKIPVEHLLGRDKITSQLSNAERTRVSHLIIIGQKEAIDNTATIRNVLTRAQDTISLAELPNYLRNIKL